MTRLNSTLTESKSSTDFQLKALYTKEKQYYTALSALIDFLQGHQKHIHTYKTRTDFEEYKRTVLEQTEKLNIRNCQKNTQNENQFNVMHYQRAILSASETNYRNMTILAALGNLTPSALDQLVTHIKKTCVHLTKEIKLEERRLIPKEQTSEKQPANAVIVSQETV